MQTGILQEDLPKLDASKGLEGAAQAMLSTFGKKQVKRLMNRLADGKGISLGTMCSGTDVAAMAFSNFTKALQDELRTSDLTKVIGCKHRFSCEISAVKRDFICVGPFRPSS